MTIIELYNQYTSIQCKTQAEADERLAFYADTQDVNYQNLQQRTINIELPINVPLPLPLDWLGLEQALYQSPLLQKGLLSQGNGFALFLKVLTDGKTTGASEQALLLAINATLQGLQGQNELTVQEITDLNTLLLQYNFTIQIA